jgi:hypothetical protein
LAVKSGSWNLLEAAAGRRSWPVSGIVAFGFLNLEVANNWGNANDNSVTAVTASRLRRPPQRL